MTQSLGGMAERLIAPVLKTGVGLVPIVGSNPTPSAQSFTCYNRRCLPTQRVTHGPPPFATRRTGTVVCAPLHSQRELPLRHRRRPPRRLVFLRLRFATLRSANPRPISIGPRRFRRRERSLLRRQH